MVNIGFRTSWSFHHRALQPHQPRFAFAAAIRAGSRAGELCAEPIAELPASQFKVLGGLMFAGVGGIQGIYGLQGRNFMPRLGLAYQLNDRRSCVRAMGSSSSRSLWTSRASANRFQPGTDMLPSVDNGLTYGSILQATLPGRLSDAGRASEG